jgi:hypothetical protein
MEIGIPAARNAKYGFGCWTGHGLWLNDPEQVANEKNKQQHDEQQRQDGRRPVAAHPDDRSTAMGASSW